MLRLFGHYVPASVVALATGEAALVFGSVFVGLALPLLGLQAIRPAWDGALAPAAVLSVLVVVMIHITGLYDTRQIYGRSEVLLRLSIAFVVAYLLQAGGDDPLAAQHGVDLVFLGGRQHIAPGHDDPLEVPAKLGRDELPDGRLVAGPAAWRAGKPEQGWRVGVDACQSQ